MLYECVISCYAQLYYKPWIQYVVHMLFIHIFISNGWMLRSVSPNFFFLQLNQLLYGEVLWVFRAVFPVTVFVTFNYNCEFKLRVRLLTLHFIST